MGGQTGKRRFRLFLFSNLLILLLFGISRLLAGAGESRQGLYHDHACDVGAYDLDRYDLDVCVYDMRTPSTALISIPR